MKPPRTKPSLLFRLIVPATVLFIMTVLALIAGMFGDPQAPVAVWLDRHGNQLLIWEFFGVLILSFLAMAIDRYRTLRGLDEESVAAADKRPETGDANESSESS